MSYAQGCVAANTSISHTLTDPRDSKHLYALPIGKQRIWEKKVFISANKYLAFVFGFIHTLYIYFFYLY